MYHGATRDQRIRRQNCQVLRWLYDPPPSFVNIEKPVLGAHLPFLRLWFHRGSFLTLSLIHHEWICNIHKFYGNGFKLATYMKDLIYINDNLTSVLLAGPVVLLVLPLAKFNFDILVPQKDPYCILLLSVMPVDVAQKKRWWNSVDWELRFGSFIPELPAGHNAGQVIINMAKAS